MLVIDNIVVRIAGREILNGASASLPAGRRIGLVGRNGAGKSTLLKVILGQMATDQGEVSWPKDWRIGAVAQEAPSGPITLLDTVLNADKERMALLSRAEHESDPHELGDIHARLEAIDAYSAPARAASILAGLGFPRGGPGAAVLGILRRLAHARGAGGDPVLRPRPAAARRADELSRPRRRLVARGLPQALPRLGDRGQPRPRPAQQRHRVHPASGIPEAHALFRQLRHFRDDARHAPRQRPGLRQEAGRRAPAHAGLRRPLQGEGLEGAPGAEPHEDARAAAEGRSAARRIHRAHQAARAAERQPAADHARQGRGRL